MAMRVSTLQQRHAPLIMPPPPLLLPLVLLVQGLLLAGGAAPPGCPSVTSATSGCGTICAPAFVPGGCHATTAAVQLLSNAASPAECRGACEAQNVSGCCAISAASGVLSCEWTAGGVQVHVPSSSGGAPATGQRSASCDGLQPPPAWPPQTATPPAGAGTSVSTGAHAVQSRILPWPPPTGTHCGVQAQGGCEGPPGAPEHSLTLLSNATESECLGACASMNYEGCCWRPAAAASACWWVGPNGVTVNRGTSYNFTSSTCSFPSPPTSTADTPLRFVPDITNAGTMDTDWIDWVVISAMPEDMPTDASRAQFLQDWDPDLIDWYGGLGFNRAEFARSRGVACSASEEYEYEESLQFSTKDTLAIFANDGMSRDEANKCAPYGPDKSKFYMELNAGKWKETIMQGDLRPAFFGDVVTQDNIGSPINKASANYDDHSNAKFLNWLWRRCTEAARTKIPCAPALDLALRNSSFNIRDHIAAVRANLSHSQPAAAGGGAGSSGSVDQVTMQPCGSAKAPAIQDLQVTPGIAGHIQFEGGKCLTSRGATKTNSGDATASACNSADPNQVWTVVDGVVRSARTDCAGATPGKDACCLSISSGSKRAGAIVQLFGCVGVSSDGFHLTFPQPGMKIARLVGNTSGLCVTAGAADAPPAADQDELIRDPIIHEFIRHGYISALQHWDDIASAVRQSQEYTGRKIPAIWGNQWGLPGVFPISALMSQTSDVVWIEGPPGDSAVSAWNALTYKVGDASGDFLKPVFTIEYGSGRATQTQLAEAHANGGLMVTSWSRVGEPAALRHAQFVSGAASRHLFVDRKRQGDVALLFSIPSIFWRRFSSLTVGAAFAPNGFQFFDYFSGIARIFEDEHISYETLMLHHPDLYWNRTALCHGGYGKSFPTRYHEFSTVVIAGVDAISDNDIILLADFVRGRSGPCGSAPTQQWLKCSGGHLIIVGAAVGSKDEELNPRSTAANGTTARDSEMLATLEAQCAANVTACKGGRISRISDADMSVYLGGSPTMRESIAQTILPQAERRFVTTLPPWIRTNFFKHGLGPMVSVTFYVADATQNGTTTPVNITLRTDAIPCYDTTTGGGVCEFSWHNLPLNAAAASPIMPTTKLSADKTHVTVTLPSVGALAVLSVGAPGEADSRAAAAQLRKAYERLKIAMRAVGAGPNPTDGHCDHGGCDPSVPQFEADSEQLLGMLQCGRGRWTRSSPCEPKTTPCQSFVSMPQNDRPVWTERVRKLTATLQKRLANVTATVTASQTASLASVQSAAKSALHAFDFGVVSPGTNWVQVSPNSSYTKRSGFGWISNVSKLQHFHPTSGNFSALEDAVAGDMSGATFAVDVPAGEYTVSILVGCRDLNFKTATTGVRDGAETQNRGIAGDRVRSGIWNLRTMPYIVGASNQLVLNFTGQAVGPQLSINNSALSTEHAYYFEIGWFVNALLIHPNSASSSLPLQALTSLAAHTAVTTNIVADWAVIGPFNDTTSTGLYRLVSPADGDDRNLSHSHSGKAPHGQVSWRRARGVLPVPVAATIGDDAKGSAAVLQTSVYCPGPTNAVVSFSTAGTGVLSIWSADKQVVNATDRVYAGLFEAEVVLNITFSAGWSDVQLKTLSHFSTVAGWEAQASVAFLNASGCQVDACGQNPTAPICSGSTPQPNNRPAPAVGPRQSQHHPHRVAAIEKLKRIMHTMPAEKAQAELEKLWQEHILDESPPRQSKIDHFVVLLMENRAADHVLGCMGIDGFDGIPPEGRMLWKNPSDHAQGGINVSCGTAAYACHESMGYPVWDAKFKPGANRLTYPYGEQSDDHSYQALQSKVPNGGASVKMFNREQLPVKAALADNFRAFNKLYSGAPASSTPNHDFVQSATSCGLRDNRNYRDCGGSQEMFPQFTIYDSMKLDNVSFKFYINSTCGLPGHKSCNSVGPHTDTSPVYAPDSSLAGVARYKDRFRPQTEFYKDAANGDLPEFTWLNCPSEAADHPCSDMAKGERCQKDIYEALRAGKGWGKTLFLIVYDDAGGTYDHVTPPFEGVPADEAPCRAPCADFDFRRLGNRLTSLLISPWLSKGNAIQEPKGPTSTSQFELSSVPATVKTLFNLTSFLTKRDAWAGSFEELLLDEPRSDTPLHLPLAPANGATWVPHPGDSWPWAPHSGTGSDPPVMQVDSRAGAEFINTESVGINVNGTTFNVTHFDDGTPRPHHCPSQGLVCPGVLAVTPKQRKNMQLYSRLTLAPEPNIEAMDFDAAERWLAGRWHDWMRQGGPLR